MSQRIVELLAEQLFVFAPFMLARIHARLFDGLDAEVYHLENTRMLLFRRLNSF